MTKVFHVSGCYEYSNWIPDVERVKSIEEADLVLIPGGADVSAHYYGEKQGPHLYSDPYADKIESEAFKKAQALGKPILGVCKGSQMVCAMSGGKVIQHQKNPAFIHEMHTADGKIIKVSSTHHNAMNPYGLPVDDYKILGWTTNASPFHLNGDNKESYVNGEKEVEVCYFNKTNALGIQLHPEMIYDADGFDETIEWCRETLSNFLNKKL